MGRDLYAEARHLLGRMSAAERLELDARLQAERWAPLPGPQMAAYNSPADVLFYGGAAGGGKSDLLVGLALTAHRRSIIYRREAKQLQAMIDRLTEILRGTEGFSSQHGKWKIPLRYHSDVRRQLELGGVKDPGSEMAYQGRGHDLKGFDEITHFPEYQFRFLNGWLRSDVEGQRQRVVCTGNPPTDSDGEWVKRYWGPWLDLDYKGELALPGELRWFAMVDGAELEVPNGEPFAHGAEILQPKSRTFIPSRVTDNIFYLRTGYVAQLQALPEPLRSQMLKGDFGASKEADPWQVIPTAWVETAMRRWKPRDQKGPMVSMGVDPSRGGRDEFIIARRHEGWWFDELLGYPGVAVQDGPTGVGLIVSARRGDPPVHIDSIGIGTSTVDFARQQGLHVVPINGAEGSDRRDRTGTYRFANRRAADYWGLRDLLDPGLDNGVALPPDPKLKADLCALRWKPREGKIYVESKEDLVKRLGRSSDRGDAIVYAAEETMPRKLESALNARSFPNRGRY